MTLNDQNISNWRVIFTVQLHLKLGGWVGVKIVHSHLVILHNFLNFNNATLACVTCYRECNSNIHFRRKSYFLNNILFTVTLHFTLILPKLIYLNHIIHLRIRLFTFLTLVIILQKHNEIVAQSSIIKVYNFCKQLIENAINYENLLDFNWIFHFWIYSI